MLRRHLFHPTALESGPSTLLPCRPPKDPHAEHAGSSQRLLGNHVHREQQPPSEPVPPRLPADPPRPDWRDRRNAPLPWVDSVLVRDRPVLSAPGHTPRFAGRHPRCGLPGLPRVAFARHRTSASVMPLLRRCPASRNSSVHERPVSRHRRRPELPPAAFEVLALRRLRTVLPSPPQGALRSVMMRDPALSDSLQHLELPSAYPPIEISSPSLPPRIPFLPRNALSAQ